MRSRSTPTRRGSNSSSALRARRLLLRPLPRGATGCTHFGVAILLGAMRSDSLLAGFSGRTGHARDGVSRVVRGRTAQKRGADFLAALVEKRTACVRQLGSTRAGQVRFGRLLHNPAVTAKEM